MCNQKQQEYSGNFGKNCIFFQNAYSKISKFQYYCVATISFALYLKSVIPHGKSPTRLQHAKIIYSSVKDFLEAFAGNKKKFDKPVLVSVDAVDVWRVGFITRLDAADLDMKEHVVVYVPHSYAISGITYIVPKEKIKPLKNISASDAMKFTLTGGVVEIDE